MDARRIQKYDLSPFAGVDRLDPVPGGLRLSGCDGDFLSDQFIHQGGFSHIGPANQGGKAGFALLVFHIFPPIVYNFELNMEF